MTLKIRSRSPKSNQLVPLSQQYIYASLVKIYTLVQKIAHGKEAMRMSTPTGPTSKTICPPPLRWGDKNSPTIPEHSEMWHYIDDVICLSMCGCSIIIFPTGWYGVCDTNRIHHWCSVGTGKFQLEGLPFQWETRLAEFPTERWTRGLGFFWNHWTVMINYFSHIPTLHLMTYCIIFFGDVTELMFTVDGVSLH